MNSQDLINRRSLLPLITFGIGLAWTGVAVAQPSEFGVACTAVHGAVLTKGKSNAWEKVEPNDQVPAGQILIALFGAELRSTNKAVDVRLIADIAQRGPFPVLEAAASFQNQKDVDLAMTLERGIGVLINKKKTGSALIHVRVGDEVFHVTLVDSTSKLGIEVYGRQPPGPARLTDAKKDDPLTNVVFFALAGEVVIGSEKQTTRLHAPPGNALMIWDRATREADVSHFEKLPDYARPMDDKERKQFETICGYTKRWDFKPGAKALEIAAAATEADHRKAAVVALGALDDLSGLMQVMNNKKNADTRDMGILVLRHWLGRAPGQSLRLYEHLTKVEGYTPIQAKSFLHLCNGVTPGRVKEPATYEILIAGLNNAKMPMRELARWHLFRLAPAGNDIPYNAAADESERMRAVKAWRELIPEGQLPPPPKKKVDSK